MRNLNTETRNGVRVIEGDWRESLYNLILESNSDVKIGARDLERTNPSTVKSILFKFLCNFCTQDM